MSISCVSHNTLEERVYFGHLLEIKIKTVAALILSFKKTKVKLIHCVIYPKTLI